jgi:chromosome segregation ATPase
MNTLRAVSLITALLMLAPLGISPVAAQGKPNNNNKKDEQRENQRVREAQRSLGDAQEKQKEAARDVAEASKALAKVESEKRQAVDKSQQLRKQLEEQHESRLGISTLLKDQEKAQKAFDAVAAPVLAKLKATQVYLAAVADAKTAHNELQAARTANPTSASGNNTFVSALVRRTLKPSELEKSALEADPPAQAARQALSPVQDQVKAAREKVKAAVDNDSSLRAALKELDQRDAAVDKAKAELGRSREKLASAENKVTQERAQLARAVAADRKDDNKNNNNNNNKPKKK